MPKVLITDPMGQTSEFSLEGARCSLGRSADNDIVLEGSQISRHHCLLSCEDDLYQIADLDSRNGVFVNGHQVQQIQLNDKDVIRVGKFTLVYLERAEGTGGVSLSTESLAVVEDYDRLVAKLAKAGRDPSSQPERDILTRQIETERQTLSLLFELSRTLSGVYSLNEIAQKAIEILLEATSADRGALFLLEDDGEELRPFLVSERGHVLDDTSPVTISSTVARQILKERKAIITVYAAEDPRFAEAESVVRNDLRSIACAPLIGTVGNLGILYLENNRFIGAFTQDDLELMCAVAAQLGLSVENVRFFNALKRSNEELEQKVEERTARLRESELKLYRAEKMASLSRLVAGVAHEINNPLGAVKANLEMASTVYGRLLDGEGSQGSDLPEQLRELSQESISACVRIMGVVRSLRTFARLDEAEFKVANLNDGLTAAVELMDPTIRRRIKFHLNFGNIPAIPCYPAFLNEAFMNLLNNACQAMPKSGDIVLETRQEGQEIVVTIRDSGTGIQQKNLNLIFDPGFTTKGTGVGAGLGLAIVYSVINEHRGKIRVESHPGQGSTFFIHLPMDLKRPESAPVRDP